MRPINYSHWARGTATINIPILLTIHHRGFGPQFVELKEVNNSLQKSAVESKSRNSLFEEQSRYYNMPVLISTSRMVAEEEQNCLLLIWTENRCRNIVKTHFEDVIVYWKQSNLNWHKYMWIGEIKFQNGSRRLEFGFSYMVYSLYCT